MATGKKSFQMYSEWNETFRELDNETAGKLIKHIFRYVNDENPDTDDSVVKLLFIPIKQQLKRDLKKWEEKVEKNTANGKLGGRPKKTEDNPIDNLETQNNRMVISETERLFEKPKKPVEEEVEVKDEVEVKGEGEKAPSTPDVISQWDSYFKSKY